MHSIDVAGFEAYCRDQKGLGEHSLRAYRQDLKAFNNYLAEADEPHQMSAEGCLVEQRWQSVDWCLSSHNCRQAGRRNRSARCPVPEFAEFAIFTRRPQ